MTVSPKDDDIHPKSHCFDILTPVGFPVYTARPPRTKFIAAYFCSDIIPEIVDGVPFSRANSPRQLMLLVDNATLHLTQESITCLEKFRVHSINHSPYSLDLVPTDF
jgi:hypothetical protein